MLIEEQRTFWNQWNECREQSVALVSEDQAKLISRWLAGKKGLDILDVGCGSGWLCERLLPFGRITGTDLADDIIERAKRRVPEATFVAGDFMELTFESSFDVIVTCEVLSHVADQAAFIARLASLLRPGGELLMATQNRWVLERCDNITPQAPGQLRRWVTRSELRQWLRPHFCGFEFTTRTPSGHQGILRLVNSVKLTAAANAILGKQRVTFMKESLGCGWTTMVRARK